MTSPQSVRQPLVSGHHLGSRVVYTVMSAAHGLPPLLLSGTLRTSYAQISFLRHRLCLALLLHHPWLTATHTNKPRRQAGPSPTLSHAEPDPAQTSVASRHITETPPPIVLTDGLLPARLPGAVDLTSSNPPTARGRWHRPLTDVTQSRLATAQPGPDAGSSILSPCTPLPAWDLTPLAPGV